MDQNSPSDIYKFVQIRSANKLTSDKLELNFIKQPFERNDDAKYWSNEYFKTWKVVMAPYYTESF